MKYFRLADQPLLIKIAFAPGLALLMLAAMAAGSIYLQKNEASELQRVVNVEMARSLQMQDIAGRIADAHGQLYLLLTHQAGKIDTGKIAAQSKTLVANLASIEKLLKKVSAGSPPAQRQQFAKLQKQLDETRSAVDLVGSMMTADFSAAVSFIDPFEQSYRQMVATLGQVVDATRKATVKRALESQTRAQEMEIISVTTALLTLLLVGALATLSVLATRADVRKIAGATETLAGGDNDIDLGALARKDEFGAIIRSLTIFRDNQVRMIRMRQEQEEARAATTREQKHVVSSLAAALDHLAGGDLTFRLNEEFSGEYAKLREDFNAAIKRLDDTLCLIWQVTTNVQTGSAEITQAADDLSRRTEHQAATLEQTAATLDEITATVKKTADGALHARQAVATAKDDAVRSGQVVDDAVQAMHEIETSAGQIGQIVSVIDEIAFQTNLLALNAGVEAARAGDAGKGFAVVASEVRALSQRSAGAAREIKSLINTSTTKVTQGVNLVGEAGSALMRIVSQVSDINDSIDQIAASAQEEATSVAQVNIAITDMDNFTQQNAAMVEQSTAASHSLAGEADELVSLLGGFRVTATRLQEGKVAPARPAAARKAPPSPVRSTPAARPALKATSRAGKALAKAPDSAPQDDWQEF
ncbi:MAG: HAMP domain-containing protein [Alphaproteobacteria bacterium]|nr:HAMP domain-containing protein [Alphaproteobacteria bacterium]MBU6471180.1 HAMP domain-containing protein [Alphaproteobacteria bacterium]MDE2013901.1 HAMP domain-containing protein [Alphaproteobacteria bacterium]MDE2073072.1 HAMP domain-containing protein [Alphaproteobacteria bacterium]MDE2351776.1 HAMP domain-containing protein [Alphaproteobacteria bacterium]